MFLSPFSYSSLSLASLPPPSFSPYFCSTFTLVSPSFLPPTYPFTRPHLFSYPHPSCSSLTLTPFLFSSLPLSLLSCSSFTSLITSCSSFTPGFFLTSLFPLSCSYFTFLITSCSSFTLSPLSYLPFFPSANTQSLVAFPSHTSFLFSLFFHICLYPSHSSLSIQPMFPQPRLLSSPLLMSLY